MLRNNNRAVVTRMARRSLISNKRRSITMILAVLLSAFLLFSVLTVGATYFKMQRLQNIRLHGAQYDAIMYGATEEQLKLCRENPDIVRMGAVGVAGYVEETPYDKTPNAGFIWADSDYWNEMMEPAREWVKGDYPKAENEVMATPKALKECGFEGVDVGDTIQMKYTTPRGSEERTFTISGMWDGFGDKKTFFVSEAFYKQSGYSLAEVASGRLHIEFKQKIMTQAEQDAFINSLNLGKQQRLFFTADMGLSVQILLGILGIVFMTCFCAYLLIYNIMYLTVAGNIRYYGLLQTVGMTGRQVHHLMAEQMLLIGGIGLIGGILLGCAVSFFLIPVTVRSLGIIREAGKIEIAFHPAVFFLTILFIGFTVFIASQKPAKMAVRCSPVEALGYRPKTGAKKSHKTGKGKILWRMAGEQLKKDKKKAFIVMLSMAASLSVFLCMTTLIHSQGAREFFYTYDDLDMVVKNDTIKKEDLSEHRQIIDEKLLNEFKETKGVKEVHPVIYTEITVPWEPEFSDKWMREFYEMWMTIPYEDEIEEYKEHPENFGSCLVGISRTDLENLNETLETPVDAKAFEKGETCILVRNGLSFKEKELLGKKVTCTEYADKENKRTFEIAGLTDETYYNALNGYPPTIIVSEKMVNTFVENPCVFKVGIRYDEEYDEDTEGRILELLQQSPDAKDFSYDSKIEEMEYVRKAQGNMMGVGIGIIAILALIGFMNYVNTTVGSIQSRQVEISVMESIGMTGKQLRKMLVMEGMLYAGGAWGITITIGLAVTYKIYQSVNYQGVPFEVPIISVLAAMLSIAIICMIVPVLVYRNLEKKGAVVERIKGFE